MGCATEFPNSKRAPHVYQLRNHPGTRFTNNAKCGPPGRFRGFLAYAPGGFDFAAEQFPRTAGSPIRWVAWSGAAGSLISLGTARPARGRLFTLAAKVPLDSRYYPGWGDSFFVRLAGWTAGARRRDSTQPRPDVAAGNPYQLIASLSRSTWGRTARSWWQSPEALWRLSGPNSFWGGEDVSSPVDTWGRPLKVTVSILAFEGLPFANTERISSLPKELFPPKRLASCARGRAGPPPPLMGGIASGLQTEDEGASEMPVEEPAPCVHTAGRMHRACRFQ